MSKDGFSFEGWLERARLQRERLNAHQISVLEAAFQFLEHGGHDYASRRLVEHFLLHSKLGLKVAQVARLVGLDRCTSSRHRPCSSSQVVQAIHNRQAGKFPGKLLPRYAGPIAQYLLEHPNATRDEVLDFLERRWQIRPGYRALDNFLRKYGLDRRSLDESGSSAPPDDTPATSEELPRTDIRVLTPASPSLILPPPAHFFCPHPVRRCILDAARRLGLAADGPGVFRR
jgi:hypothetical protein